MANNNLGKEIDKMVENSKTEPYYYDSKRVKDFENRFLQGLSQLHLGEHQDKDGNFNINSLHEHFKNYYPKDLTDAQKDYLTDTFLTRRGFRSKQFGEGPRQLYNFTDGKKPRGYGIFELSDEKADTNKAEKMLNEHPDAYGLIYGLSENALKTPRYPRDADEYNAYLQALNRPDGNRKPTLNARALIRRK